MVDVSYVPEGRAHVRRSFDTADKCQAACAVNDKRNAFSFRIMRPLCSFYAVVYMGSECIQRSGLSIVLKQGFVSVFKHLGFPPAPR